MEGSHLMFAFSGKISWKRSKSYNLALDGESKVLCVKSYGYRLNFEGKSHFLTLVFTLIAHV